MKLQRLLIILTITNLCLLAFLLMQVRAVEADSVAPVLRGRALEIVDTQGRVRASIKLHPASTAPDRKPYPETVMFRLSDASGRPEVKLGASEHGGGIGFIGETDKTHALLQAEGLGVMLKLTNGDGRQQIIKP